MTQKTKALAAEPLDAENAWACRKLWEDAQPLREHLLLHVWARQDIRATNGTPANPAAHVLAFAMMLGQMLLALPTGADVIGHRMLAASLHEDDEALRRLALQLHTLGQGGVEK